MRTKYFVVMGWCLFLLPAISAQNYTDLQLPKQAERKAISAEEQQRWELCKQVVIAHWEQYCNKEWPTREAQEYWQAYCKVAYNYWDKHAQKRPADAAHWEKYASYYYPRWQEHLTKQKTAIAQTEKALKNKATGKLSWTEYCQIAHNYWKKHLDQRWPKDADQYGETYEIIVREYWTRNSKQAFNQTDWQSFVMKYWTKYLAVVEADRQAKFNARFNAVKPGKRSQQQPRGRV